jgi:hypothetical protein
MKNRTVSVIFLICSLFITLIIGSSNIIEGFDASFNPVSGIISVPDNNHIIMSLSSDPNSPPLTIGNVSGITPSTIPISENNSSSGSPNGVGPVIPGISPDTVPTAGNTSSSIPVVQPPMMGNVSGTYSASSTDSGNNSAPEYVPISMAYRNF